MWTQLYLVHHCWRGAEFRCGCLEFRPDFPKRGANLDEAGIPMRLSQYFMPILRDDPKEAEIVSHKLMLRTGMIRQEAAGSYSWLPMGYKVLRKIEQIVREEQNRAGAIE